jgi:hypothetical protein
MGGWLRSLLRSPSPEQDIHAPPCFVSLGMFNREHIIMRSGHSFIVDGGQGLYGND